LSFRERTMSVAGATVRVLREGPLQALRSRTSIGDRDLSTDLLAFAGTVAVAAAFRWEARDVIWGLWISSLTVGYATIVSNIVRGVLSVAPRYRVPAVVGGLGALAFFTVHFGMFHFVHATFLSAFFPLVQSGDSFPNFAVIIGRSLSLFWPLVAASFLSRFRDVFPASDAPAGGASFAAPYGNVVRMHLLIFVFAGLSVAGLSRLAILPVLAAYFFPWKAALARLRHQAE